MTKGTEDSQKSRCLAWSQACKQSSKDICPKKEEKRRRLREVQMSATGFLSLSITDLWSQVILCCGSCPVHHRVFSSTSGLYPVMPVTSLPFHPTRDNQTCQDFAKCPLGMQSSLVENCWPKGI